MGAAPHTVIMTVLETERLVLRPLTGDDFDDYAAMTADPQVADGLADPIGRTPSDAWRNLALFIGHREIRGYSHWAVVERATGRFVGRAGPWQPTALKADEVISVIRPGNTRSIAVAQRIGHHFLRETNYKNAPALIYGQQSQTP